LLVSECDLIVRGRDGIKKVGIDRLFNEHLRLEPGELLIRIEIDREITGLPFVSLKTTADGEVGYPQNRIGYPVVSAAGLEKDGKVQVSFSGVCGFPFRSKEVESHLNNFALPEEERIKNALQALLCQIISDMESSAGYRQFVFKNTITSILERLRNKNVIIVEKRIY